MKLGWKLMGWALASALAAACADGGGDGTVPAGGGSGDAGPQGGTGGGGGDGQGCLPTCPSPGAKECTATGFRTCADLNGDGCAEWSEPSACPGSCANGECVDCVNDCEPGALRCGPGGGVQDCTASGDDDPCFEWAAEADCAAGESCSAGQCAPAGECTNECAKVGDRRCDGSGFQECQTSPDDDCLHYGPTTACAEGESCSLDECRPLGECQDECQGDSRRCDPAGVSTCSNFDEDPCLEWGAAVPCEGEQVCSNGECADSCGDECGAEGQRQCAGNDVQSCGNFDDDDCLEWGPPSSCEDGQVCSNGNCRAACINECAEGTMQCAPGGAQTCGQFDGDDCTEWSEAVPCDLNETCSNGVCSQSCANECGVLNARQCSGAGFQVCGNFDEDGCLEWGVEQGCAAGQVCAGGECAGQCSNECAEGSVQCAGNGSQTCGNFDEDACLEWAAIVPCPEGQVCSNGQCGNACGNECVNGATRCAPGGVQTCGNNDADECTDWGPGVPCPAGQVCSNGQCSETCADECPVGATRCSAGGVETCGNFDGDECAEWSLGSPCPRGQFCSSGACAVNCSDECETGSLQCAGNGFQTCGEFDGDRCADWSPVVACQDGTTCSAGVCSQFCSDECSAGATRCGGAGVQVCGNFDPDGCTDWGPGVPCPDGQACNGGRCIAGACQDECDAGASRCDAGGLQSCGNFDNDGCQEWSGSTPCPDGQICAEGECQALDAGCAQDADCPDGLFCFFGLCFPGIGCQVDGDCPAGERCDVLGGNVCRRDAPSGIGASCASDNDCQDGQTCVNAEEGGYCTIGCAAEFPCPSGSTCYVVDPETPDSGACLTDCAGHDMCPDNQACFETGGPLGGACFLAECRQDQDCGGDPLIDRVCDGGLCVQQNGCDLATGEGCAAGTECWQHNGVGVCLEGCNIFEGACAGGARCIPVSIDGGGFCAPAGNAGVGGLCTETTDCQANLFCVDDGVGNQSCRTLCNTDEMDACGGGEVCVSLGGNVGVCIAPCDSECNANETRCTPQGVQACGQNDDDLCLEWGRAAACAAGQSCNDLTGACEASCRNDQDCFNPVVPMACQQGACRVQSECDPATGMGCNAPEQCFLATNSGGGVCLQTCDPLGADCGGGQACVQFGGAAYCLNPGRSNVGDVCGTSADCVAGAACLDDGTGSQCYGLCNVMGGGPGCDGGQTCVDLGIDGRLGACVDSCVDECQVEGATVCSADGTGIQTCGQLDDDACLDLGPAAACENETRCNPNTTACEYYCEEDAHCPEGFGVPYTCANNECVARDCRVGMDACAPGVQGTVCVPASADDPQAGLCLRNCDPIEAGDCGAFGVCDFVGDGAGGIELVCLPAGAAAEFEDCSADRCQPGMGCLPFDDGMGGNLFACVFYCDTRAGNGDCNGQGTICEPVPDLGANVGVCLPAQ